MKTLTGDLTLFSRITMISYLAFPKTEGIYNFLISVTELFNYLA